MNKRFPSFTIITLSICLVIIGIAFVPLLPVKLNSSRTLPEITVSYSMTGASGRVIESEVTSKLEAMFARIKGVKSIESSSYSTRRNSYIRLKFDKWVNMDIARFEVSNAVRQAWPELPAGLSYPVIYAKNAETESSDRIPFLTYTINASQPPYQIQQYAENNIRPELASIEGVNMIEISGASPMEWVLEYDSRQLETLGLSPSDITSAVSAFTRKEHLGMGTEITDSGDFLTVRMAIVPEKKFDLADISSIPVKMVGGRIITLDKLVTVRHSESKPTSYYRINGLNTVYMRVYAENSANQIKLGAQVREAMERLKEAMPPGYETSLSYDATEYINAELNKIYFRSGLTIAILLLFVLVVSGSFRYLAMITFSMIANLAIGAILYYFAGVEIHLFSLAGLTISLGLIMDNTIVMADHLKHRRNFRVFLAILAATLTTISAIVVVFFLPEEVRISLEDFSMIIIINLAVSLFTALFLVPALMDKLGIFDEKKLRLPIKKHLPAFIINSPLRGKRRIAYFNRFFSAQMRFIYRFRVPAVILMVLAFGLPVFKLPEKIKSEGFWAEKYNATLGSQYYKEKIKPIADKALGGTLRLFADKVSKGSYGGERGETTLNIYASMPSGTTLEQMNAVIMKMESYLTGFPEIRQFQTNVSPQSASIRIYFTKDAERSSFPYMLKDNAVSKAVELGGASWGVYGVGDGFNNNVSESAGNITVTFNGYNYDQLWAIAEQFKEKLLTNQRIKEVNISSERSWTKNDYSEYFFGLDNLELVRARMTPSNLLSSVTSMLGSANIASVQGESYMEQVRIESKQGRAYDVWNLNNTVQHMDSIQYKMASFATIEKGQAPQSVRKTDQQYNLILQYDYIGSPQSGEKILKQYIEEFKETIPVGYTIKNDRNYWNWNESAGQYLVLGLIAVIIFFLCSILFNSLKQPVAVIMVIPISLIGLFATFYLFDIRVDQGCFAAMILLSGITVNASIYILNDYNNLRKTCRMSRMDTYKKAFNSKITSIMLTILSTILGFVPFIIGTKEAFWYPLAIGTIGGLLMSLVGIYFFLPVFMGIGREHGQNTHGGKKHRFRHLLSWFCKKTSTISARVRRGGKTAEGTTA